MSPKEQRKIQTHLKAQTIYDANNTCMSVEECANYLGVSKITILRNIKKGKIKGTLLGKGWSIPKIQFLEQIISNHN